MCVGIIECGKKSCLEMEMCIEKYLHRIPVKRKKKKNQEPRINACQRDKKFCSNSRSCEILGQCILDHPLVKADKHATKILRKPCHINQILRVMERLMPPVTLRGKLKNFKSRR